MLTRSPSLAAATILCCSTWAIGADFPQSWQGVWKGEAEARGGDPARPPMQFRMELHVGPLEAGLDADPKPRRKWTIVYDGAQGRQERNYHLVDRDAEKGLYEIDERNSIVLPATLIGDALVCPFEVGGTMLVCTYRFDAQGEGPQDDRINFEIVSIPTGKAETTGGQQGVQEVKGYPAASIQNATLHRQPAAAEGDIAKPPEAKAEVPAEKRP